MALPSDLNPLSYDKNNKVGTILSFEGSKAVVQLDNSSEIVSAECSEINKLIVFM